MTKEEALTLLINNGAGYPRNLYFDVTNSGEPFVGTEENLDNVNMLRKEFNGSFWPIGTYTDRVKMPKGDYYWSVVGDDAVALCELLVTRKDFKQRCPYKYQLALEIIARAKAKEMAS